MKTIGLALGGGAARGLAHLGVLEVLGAAGLPIRAVAGSSIGGIVAAMYAFQPDPVTITTRVRHYVQSPLFQTLRFETVRKDPPERRAVYKNWRSNVGKSLFFATSLRQKSFVSPSVFHRNLEVILENAPIETSPIKLALVTFDIESGEEIVLRQGPLIESAMASCAIPSMFPPMKLEGRTLMDGSWINPVPCSVVRQLGVDLVLGIDVTVALENNPVLENGYQLALRAGEITRAHLKRQARRLADFWMEIDTMDIHWADFSRFETCVQRGRDAAQAALPQLEALLRH